MVHTYTARHSLGGYFARAKTYIGHLDTGIRVAHAIYGQVKDKLPQNQITKTAAKGFSEYEKAREAIRMAGST